VLDVPHVAVADDHVGPPGHDRRHQRGDGVRRVLVVGVGVDDHVGAQLQGGVEAGLERGGQALVVRQLHDVVDAMGPGHLDGAVGRPVVDDEPLDPVDARHAAGQVGQGGGKLILFVEARELDDELHGACCRDACCQECEADLHGAAPPKQCASPGFHRGFLRALPCPVSSP
jgi:hypothetical protein